MTIQSKKINVAYASAMIVMMLASMVGIVPQKAEAALSAVGPILDPVNNGFPQFYSDENGLSLQLCIDQDPRGLCILTPGFDPLTPPVTPIGTVASGIFPDESFYFIADALLDPGVRLPGANTDIKITYRAALEQAFLAGIAPGAQNIFLRVQADINGLVPNETYTVTHPYGTMTVVADATGGGRTRFEDLGSCVNLPTGLFCTFADPSPAVNPVLGAPTTNVGAFLQWDPAVAPAAPAGFIGDPNVTHAVIGGRGGVNSVTVTGLNVGGVGVNTLSTSAFAVAGKLADTVPPVITLNGADPFSVTAGTAYVEPGATAFDAFDATTTVVTVSTSTVPAGNLVIGTGPFTVTYRAADKAGNVATLTRTVNVVPDVIAPVITMNGAATSTIKVGTPFTDPGATATDNVDGTIAVTATGTVNTAIAGVYTITYTATDSSSNVATATRTVTVAADVTAPVITIAGANPASVSFGATYTDAGATALDDFDGVRTVAVAGLPIDTRTAVSPVTITYTASDLSGNTATATRTVNIVPDTTAPVITIAGANPMTVELNTVFTDPGATALDDVDGARPVTATGTVNTAVAGANTITYTASDTSGNIATITRTVNVATDATAPVITITGANPVSVLVGATYTDAGATAVDNIDGVIASSSIAVTGLPIATTATGTFSVVYTVADAAGNTATATRTVNVVTDVTAPVITITGANPASITVGTAYTDAGATAADDIDGNITARITSTSTVNASAIGTYTVTYAVSDLAGNAATATRTVNVTAVPVASGGGGGGGGGGSSYYLSLIANPNAPTSTTSGVSNQGQNLAIGQVLGVSRHMFSSDMRRGSRSDDVHELQLRLRDEGFFKVEPTGFFGPVTADALKKFQKKHGLAETGIFDKATRDKMNEGTEVSSNSGTGKVAGASRASDDAIRAQIAELRVKLLELMQQLLEQLKAGR